MRTLVGVEEGEVRGARLGGDPYKVDLRVDLGLDRLVSVGVDFRVDA